MIKYLSRIATHVRLMWTWWCQDETARLDLEADARLARHGATPEQVAEVRAVRSHRRSR